MEIEIKVTGKRGCGKTTALALIVKQLEHHIGNVTVKKMWYKGETEVWHLWVEK